MNFKKVPNFILSIFLFYSNTSASKIIHKIDDKTNTKLIERPLNGNYKNKKKSLLEKIIFFTPLCIPCLFIKNCLSNNVEIKNDNIPICSEKIDTSKLITIKFNFCGSSAVVWGKKSNEGQFVKDGFIIHKQGNFYVQITQKGNTFTIYFSGPSVLEYFGNKKIFNTNNKVQYIKYYLSDIFLKKDGIFYLFYYKLNSIFEESNKELEIIFLFQGHSRGAILSNFALQKVNKLFQDKNKDFNYKIILYDPVPGSLDSKGKTINFGIGSSYSSLEDAIKNFNDIKKLKRVIIYSLYGHKNIMLKSFFCPFNNYGFDTQKDICILECDNHNEITNRFEGSKKILYKTDNQPEGIKNIELSDCLSPGIYYAYYGNHMVHKIKSQSELVQMIKTDTSVEQNLKKIILGNIESKSDQRINFIFNQLNLID